ncbi:MAG: lactoylglutathione lyase [Proteobacteria bacterium]|nr:lactoylglutathione lyase [Pseudomonadota bacterium]
MNDTPAADPRPASTKPRIRHTMVRVKDLEKSVQFYSEVLGMKEFRRSENESGKYSVVFMGYGDENSDPAIELTYNWGQDDGYDIGTGYGHIAIGFPDIYEVCKRVEDFGMEVPRPPGPLKGRGPNGPVIAFIRDPDGYSIELGQRV